MRVRKYFTYIDSEEKESLDNEKQLISKLSQSL